VCVTVSQHIVSKAIETDNKYNYQTNTARSFMYCDSLEYRQN
jgi:hypothetical protein